MLDHVDVPRLEFLLVALGLKPKAQANKDEDIAQLLAMFPVTPGKK